MDDRKEFVTQVVEEIQAMHSNKALHDVTASWMQASLPINYSYHFSWMGLPIIQYPQDIVAMQEIIWKTKPDCIIETGVARGGSAIFYASMMKMMDLPGIIIGVDIDIRPHNRESIEKHPLSSSIKLIEGSSVAPETVAEVKKLTKDKKRILVIFDSMHTHEHVLAELQAYSPLVTKDCYLVVFDTIVEDMPDNFFLNRPWGKGNNPKTAVHEFLKTTDRFILDSDIQTKLQITAAPDGYLKCIKD